MRQLTKVFGNARSWHGSQLFIEEEDRVCLGLRLGLRKRRNGGLDCCCHRNSSLLVDIGGRIASRLGTAAALNQDRTAIYYNGLPSAESFLHQKQIGLRHVMSLAD